MFGMYPRATTIKKLVTTYSPARTINFAENENLLSNALLSILKIPSSFDSSSSFDVNLRCKYEITNTTGQSTTKKAVS